MNKIILNLLFIITVNSQAIDIKLVESLYENYIDDFGRVHYREMKKNDSKSLAKLMKQVRLYNPMNRPDLYKTKNDRLAAWLNIYNLIVINEVVQHYPIHSIQEVENVWKKKRNLGTVKLSLDEIEHEIIRKKFNEPKTHFALICAASSCPKLQKICYKGFKLEEQLDEITIDFFRNDITFRLDKKDKSMLVSKLFEWYLSDFNYRPLDKDISLLPADKIIIKYVAEHAPRDIATFVREHQKELKVDYMLWHWDLNESLE